MKICNFTIQAWVAVTILLVVLVSGSLSYYQDRSSSRIMDSFKNMIPDVA